VGAAATGRPLAQQALAGLKLSSGDEADRAEGRQLVRQAAGSGTLAIHIRDSHTRQEFTGIGPPVCIVESFAPALFSGGEGAESG